MAVGISPPLILVVDDDPAHRLMLRTLLDDWGYKVDEAGDGLAAVEYCRKSPPDLVLMDVRMPGMDGMKAAADIHGYNPAVPIIIMTAYSSISSAVKALKGGAYDYLTKPLDFDALRLTIERAMEHRQLKEENKELREQLVRLRLPEILGRSPAMDRLAEMLTMVAPSEATVLITGESGTGKGLVARAIHANSGRTRGQLVEVNCAAIPETLVESELFGYEKGAFTGADRRRKGRFLSANKGTIFLDEIAELPLLTQAKLLRVLQDGVIQPVGSDTTITVDVRVVAATNQDLKQMVSEGLFREDLYYRLNVVAIEVPPLRERKDDIPMLAEHFWRHFSEKNRKPVRGMNPRAMDILLKYTWPGNVRELENVMERAVILLQGEFITEKELPLNLKKQVAEDTGIEEMPVHISLEDDMAGYTLADMEKRMIFHVLEATGGNKSAAARRLGITRRTLKLKLKKYALEDSPFVSRKEEDQ